jgi:hypothetical protein
MGKSRKICVVGIVFAVLLAVGITYAGNSVLASISAESTKINRDVAHGDSTFTYVNRSGSYTDYAYNMNVTALFPRAVLDWTYNYNVTVFLAIMLPANASYYYGYEVDWYFYSGSNVSATTGHQAWGEFFTYPNYGAVEGAPMGILVKGEPMGEAGIGFWNDNIYVLPPPGPFSSYGGPVSWLSFTSQTEDHLSIFLYGDGNVTASNGTVYAYKLLTLFNFQNSTTTFYLFGYPVAAYLGYISSFVIVVVSLNYLISRRKRKQVKKDIRETALKQNDTG